MNMTCYWNNPELTGEILVNGFVCTNDIGYFDEDGYAYVVGRRDDVINCNGIKISPTEIEDIVITYPAVSETALVGKPDPIAGQIPKLYIVVKDPASFNSEDFWSFLSNRMDKTKMPKSFEIIDALPRTYNGKLNRKELERL
jgi:long-chain acyl-CoA synthetase